MWAAGDSLGADYLVKKHPKSCDKRTEKELEK
jgi:hypothetical protein